MRHKVDGRKFGRNTSHRVAMFKNLANSVIEKEQIETTVEKAKEARRVVDKLITLAKKQNLASRRLAFARTRNAEVVDKLFTTLAERYKNRVGGYTRIVKLSDTRRGDAARMAILELVDHPVLDRKRKPKAADAAKAEGEGADSKQVTDPFGRFRKLFSGKKQNTGKANPAAAKAKAQPKAARRTSPAGGGSSKARGSS